MSESAEDLYRTVFEGSPDGVLVVDEAGRIVDANPRVGEMFGHRREELIGEAVELLVPEAARRAHRSHREAYAEDPHNRPMGAGLELKGRRRDGREFPVEISLNHVATPRGPRVVATVRDVSERRRLRDFGAGALRAAEDERQRIARELHDDTAQHLATLMVMLRVWERAGVDDDWADHLEDVRTQLEACADSVRRIARGLRPPELEDAGLVAALRSHARLAQESFGIRVDVDAVPVEALLDTDSRLILYRVVQEAVSNALRHGNPSRVSIAVNSRDGDVFTEVADDGKGFDPRNVGSADRGGGLGLMGMRERAAMVGGSILIESQPGEGTTVRLRLRGSDPAADTAHPDTRLLEVDHG